MSLNTTTATTATQHSGTKKERWYNTAAELHRVEALRKQYMAEEARLKEELKDLSDHKSMAYREYFFVKTTRKGNVVYSSIPELQGINLDKFRGEPIEAWKLTRKD